MHGGHLSAEEQAVRISELQREWRCAGREAGQHSRGRERGWTKAARCARRKLAAGGGGRSAPGLPRHPSREHGWLQSLALSNLLEPEEHRGYDTQDDGAQKQDLPWGRSLLKRSRPGEATASGRRAEARCSSPSPPTLNSLNKSSRTVSLRGKGLTRHSAHRGEGKAVSCCTPRSRSCSIHLQIIILDRQDCSHFPLQFK